MLLLLKYILLLGYNLCFWWVLGDKFISNYHLVWIFTLFMTLTTLLLLRLQLKTQSFSKIFFIGTFILLISIPFVGEKENTSFENRTLTAFPAFRMSNPWKFFNQYQNYFNDRFAFRNIAVQSISKFRYYLFGVSPMPKLVEIGKNNWLYTSNSKYITDTSTPFTNEELEKVILNLKITTKYFDLRGIRYYFTMVPVKERIYPEYMPELLKYRMRFSKAEQLHEELLKHPSVRAIDVKDVLIEGKKVRPTYYTIDTHWNEYGAFLAYRKIIERIRQDFPQITPSEIQDYHIDSVIIDGGDLQLLMGFRDVMKFKRYFLTHKTRPEPAKIDSSDYEPGSTAYSIREMPVAASGLKLFLVRDSFSEHLRTFITPDFDRTVLAWKPVVPVVKIMSEKPDIILHEILEHFAPFTLELPPEIKSDTLFLNTHFPGYLN